MLSFFSFLKIFINYEQRLSFSVKKREMIDSLCIGTPPAMCSAAKLFFPLRYQFYDPKASRKFIGFSHMDGLAW